MNTSKIELSVLISMMPDDEIRNYGLSELDQHCFVYEQNKLIFTKIKDIHAQNRQPTLENTNFDEAIYNQAIEYGILELAEFRSAVDELLNWRSCRELIQMAQMVMSIASAGNFKRAFEYNVGQIGKINTSQDTLSFVDFKAAAEKAKDRIISMVNGDVDKFFVPSGYKEFDRLYMGLPVGLITIAADSGEGKSTVVLPTILANQDKDIFVASTEVSPEGISANISAIQANIFRSDIHRGKLQQEELNQYIQTLDNCIAKLKGGVTMQRKLSRIVAEMKLWRAKTDKSKIGIVVIDFLNDIFDDYGNTYADDKLIRNAVSIIKGLSKELNVCMIMLSQFNQLRKSRKDKEPCRDFIYGSAAVYQSSDVVIYPYRPVMWMPNVEKVFYEGKRYEDAYLVVDKFKENGLRKIPMIFDAFVTQFMDIPKRPTQTLRGMELLPFTASKLNDEFELKIKWKK